VTLVVTAMQKAALVLNFVSAASALIAAIFWYLSARKKLPAMLAYWDRAPDTDPFFVAIQAGVRLNRWAAGFAALSAFSTGLATLASLK
jgi:hypothetical protein